MAVLLGLAIAALIGGMFRGIVSRTPGQARSSGNAWLAGAMREIGRSYGQAQDLAIASYRLERALRTGRTTNAPWRSVESELIDDLRGEFAEIVSEIGPNVLEEMGYRPSRTGEAVEVDIFPDLTEELQRLESDTEAYTRKALREIGPEAYATLAESQKAIEDEFDELYERQAAAAAAEAARIARLGGRRGRRSLYERDETVLGYARVCAEPGMTPDHPCHFCSMLMARGLVYKSAAAALGDSPDGYHTNCDCEAIEVWSQEDFDTDERFNLNREFKRLWESEISGKHGGREARNAWRRLLYAQRRDAREAFQAQEAQDNDRTADDRTDSESAA